MTFEYKDRAIARSNVYRLLSRVYARPPDESFLKLLEEWTSSLLKSDNSGELPLEMQESLRKLERLLKDKPTSTLIEKANSDFTKLFRGIKKYYPPPPYESVYSEGRTFGDITSHVHHHYLSIGIDLEENLRSEPSDYIAFELEFMQVLCEREATAWAKKDEQEAIKLVEIEMDFLSNHLLNWVPNFCEQVTEHDKFGLFKYLTKLTIEWMRFDYEQLQRYINIRPIPG